MIIPQSELLQCRFYIPKGAQRSLDPSQASPTSVSRRESARSPLPQDIFEGAQVLQSLLSVNETSIEPEVPKGVH